MPQFGIIFKECKNKDDIEAFGKVVIAHKDIRDEFYESSFSIWQEH